MLKNLVRRFYVSPKVKVVEAITGKHLIYFTSGNELALSAPKFLYDFGHHNKLELNKQGVTKFFPSSKSLESITIVKVPEPNSQDAEEQIDLLKEYTAKGISLTSKVNGLDIVFSSQLSLTLKKKIVNFLILGQYKFNMKSANKEKEEVDPIKSEPQEAETKKLKKKKKHEVESNAEVSESESSLNTKTEEIKEINIVNSDNRSEFSLNQLNTQITLSLMTNESRHLANTRANIANTNYIYNKAVELKKEFPKLIEVDHIKDLEKEGYNLIYNVGKAALSPPKIVFINYYGAGKSNSVDYAIVGKGLTFDTGGLNIKTSNMESMFYDKQGACNTISIMKALAILKPNINVVGVIGLAENSVDSNSYRPSDILKSKNGLTVEVGNTDAEGRLVLADCFTAVQLHYKDLKVMIDMATLTGACRASLGNETAGLFSNNKKLVDALVASSK